MSERKIRKLLIIFREFSYGVDAKCLSMQFMNVFRTGGCGSDVRNETEWKNFKNINLGLIKTFSLNLCLNFIKKM